MSYCRWSSDNWRSDVYVFQSDAGYETHVAAMRVVGEIPAEPPMEELLAADTTELRAAWLEKHKAVMAFLEGADRQPIGLPCDGLSFVDDSPGGCADTLETLAKSGYNVPRFAIDELRSEEENSTASATSDDR